MIIVQYLLHPSIFQVDLEFKDEVGSLATDFDEIAIQAIDGSTDALPKTQESRLLNVSALVSLAVW